MRQLGRSQARAYYAGVSFFYEYDKWRCLLSSDVELIVNAIEGLHTNIIKDYILPVGSILISGALGVG